MHFRAKRPTLKVKDIAILSAIGSLYNLYSTQMYVGTELCCMVKTLNKKFYVYHLKFCENVLNLTTELPGLIDIKHGNEMSQ